MSCYVVILCSFKYKRSSISALRFQLVWFDFLLSCTSNFHEIKINNHICVFSAWSYKQILPLNMKNINDKSNGFSWVFRRDKPTLGVCMGKTMVNSYSIGSQVITDLSSTVKIITNWNLNQVFCVNDLLIYHLIKLLNIMWKDSMDSRKRTHALPIPISFLPLTLVQTEAAGWTAVIGLLLACGCQHFEVANSG